jgi:glucokinase
MLIAGDIGATKTLLALYTPEAGARAPLLTAEFPSADYPGLAELVRELMTQTKRPIETACFDVAGPVIGGRAHLTNLPWLLEEESLRQTLGLQRVMLLNDLNAVAYAVPHLQPDELHTINAGTPVSHGSIAVIAPGTGLGEAFLVWDGGK